MSQAPAKSFLKSPPRVDSDKAATERRTAVHALGLVQALRRHRLTIDQAWDELFSFTTYMDLKKHRSDPRLLKLLEWAMELPHVEPLGEAALSQSYNAIEQLAESVLAGKVAHGRQKQRRIKKVE